MKLTKRKGFNFFRSYFDVYNELEDADKLAFIDALLNRQFLGEKPENLTGMAKFAYISQTNSIDSQVKGYEDKTKTRLDGSPYTRDKIPPTVGGGVRGEIPPTEQVEEKEKEKEEEEHTLYTESDFLKNWNEARSYSLDTPSNLNKLKQEESDLFYVASKEYKKEDFHLALKGLFSQESVPRDVMWFRPKHFLDNIDTYIDAQKNKRYKLYAS